MAIDYEALGRDVKEAHPGDYDSFSDEAVGKAYAAEHMPRPEPKNVVSTFLKRKKLEANNKRLEAVDHGDELRERILHRMHKSDRDAQKDEILHENEISTLLQARETAELTHPLVLQLAKRDAESKLLISLNAAAMNLSPESYERTRLLDHESQIRIAEARELAGIEVYKTAQTESIKLQAEKLLHREQLEFMKEAKEIESGRAAQKTRLQIGGTARPQSAGNPNRPAKPRPDSTESDE